MAVHPEVVAAVLPEAFMEHHHLVELLRVKGIQGHKAFQELPVFGLQAEVVVLGPQDQQVLHPQVVLAVQAQPGFLHLTQQLHLAYL